MVKLLDELPFQKLVVKRATWDKEQKKWVESKPKEKENDEERKG